MTRNTSSRVLEGLRGWNVFSRQCGRLGHRGDDMANSSANQQAVCPLERNQGRKGTGLRPSHALACRFYRLLSRRAMKAFPQRKTDMGSGSDRARNISSKNAGGGYRKSRLRGALSREGSTDGPMASRRVSISTMDPRLNPELAIRRLEGSRRPSWTFPKEGSRNVLCFVCLAHVFFFRSLPCIGGISRAVDKSVGLS